MKFLTKKLLSIPLTTSLSVMFVACSLSNNETKSPTINNDQPSMNLPPKIDQKPNNNSPKPNKPGTESNKKPTNESDKPNMDSPQSNKPPAKSPEVDTPSNETPQFDNPINPTITTQHELDEILNKITLASKINRWPSGIRRRLNENLTNIDTEFQQLIQINNLPNDDQITLKLVSYADNIFWNTQTLNDLTGTLHVKIQLQSQNLKSQIQELKITNTYSKDRKFLTSDLILPSSLDRSNVNARVISNYGNDDNEKVILPYIKFKEEFLDFESNFIVNVYVNTVSRFKSLGAVQLLLLVRYGDGTELTNDALNNSIWLYGFGGNKLNLLNTKNGSNIFPLTLNPNVTLNQKMYTLQSIQQHIKTLKPNDVWNYLKSLSDYRSRTVSESIVVNGISNIYRFLITEAISIDGRTTPPIFINDQDYFLIVSLADMNVTTNEQNQITQLNLKFNLINRLDNKLFSNNTLDVSIKVQ